MGSDTLEINEKKFYKKKRFWFLKLYGKIFENPDSCIKQLWFMKNPDNPL